MSQTPTSQDVADWYAERPCSTCAAGKLLEWGEVQSSFSDKPRHAVKVGDRHCAIYCWLMKTRVDSPDLLLSCEAHKSTA